MAFVQWAKFDILFPASFNQADMAAMEYGCSGSGIDLCGNPADAEFRQIDQFLPAYGLHRTNNIQTHRTATGQSLASPRLELPVRLFAQVYQIAPRSV